MTQSIYCGCKGQGCLYCSSNILLPYYPSQPTKPEDWRKSLEALMPEESLATLLPALRERAKALRAKIGEMSALKSELEKIEAMLQATERFSTPHPKAP